MSYAKLRPRRGTKSEWELINPILMEGEMGIEYPDTGIGTGLCKFKLGDGFKKWQDLPYAFNAKAAEAIYGGTVSVSHDIWLRSGTTEEWLTYNPVLGLGEIVYDRTKQSIKIGDGEHHFEDIDYIGYYWDLDGDFDFRDIDESELIPGPEDKDYDFGDIDMMDTGESGGGAEAGSGNVDIKIGDVRNANIYVENGAANITWKDPNDILSNGSLLSGWSGTIVVRNEGRVPTNKEDGVTIVDNKIKNNYATNGFKDDGIVAGRIYYYRFFTYNTNNTYTTGTTLTLDLTKIKIPTPVQSTPLVYDGTEKVAVFDNFDPSQLTVSRNSATTAGTYTAIFTPTSNYCWEDYTTNSKLVTWTIDKAEATATFSTSAVTLNKDTLSQDVTILTKSGNVLNVVSDDTDIATATLNNDIITINSHDKKGVTNITVVLDESNNYKAGTVKINVVCSFLKIVTFKDGTDIEIAAMINAHYNNEINISNYWSVGDKRSIDLSAMEPTYTGESHRAQTVEIAIADFEKDELATPINGHSKAAITLTQVDCLMDQASEDNPGNGISNTENGCMNKSDTNEGGWDQCARRKWCNDIYYNALPESLRSLVKEVNKLTFSGTTTPSNINISVDKIFLLSEEEIFGTAINSYPGEGEQYSYYKITPNRYKRPVWSSSGYNSSIYWERSPVGDGKSSFFCNTILVSSNTSDASALECYGIAPNFCF